jgi:phytoene/squalene synthetase
MSNHVIVSGNLSARWNHPDRGFRARIGEQEFDSNLTLPARITKASSKQTYYTIRFLVDRDRVSDAFRAYAYFRWVDDRLDQRVSDRLDRIAFAERQQALIERGYRGERLGDLTPEEHLLAELIRSDHEPASGLQSYIRNLMAVMVFDAERRGRLISHKELTDYSRHLSIAVTEALHYFIGHGDPSPQSEARYLPVIAAHITHMLRDTFEDAAAGYFNVPGEFLQSHGIGPRDVNSDPYRAWVKSRVELARVYFKAGEGYLAQVENRRCRIAGWAYMARFEGILDAIERDGYRLRPDYPERKSLGAALRLSRSVIAGSLGFTAARRFATP